MEIRVADFEKLSLHFNTYQIGIEKINNRRKEIIDSVEPQRKEMQMILNTSQKGIVLDNKTEQERYLRFKQLQEELIRVDKDAAAELAQLKDELNKETYRHLEGMVSEWSIKNGIDLVIGKLEVVYLSEKYEITNEILEMMKEKGLYTDNEEEVETETEKESV